MGWYDGGWWAAAAIPAKDAAQLGPAVSLGQAQISGSYSYLEIGPNEYKTAAPHPKKNYRLQF